MKFHLLANLCVCALVHESVWVLAQVLDAAMTPFEVSDSNLGLRLQSDCQACYNPGYTLLLLRQPEPH